MNLGIDVSRYQGAIDWPKVYAAGIRFAFARASYGAGTPDPKYAVNVRRACRAGLVVGAYHFLVHGSPEAQADYFMSRIHDPSGLLVAVDVEEEGSPTIADVRAFVARWRTKHPAHKVFVYTNPNTWRYRLGNPAGAALGPLWLAHWVGGTGSPGALYRSVPSSYWTPGLGGWAAATLLQFTSKASVAGITGNVDADAYRGTIKRLRTYGAGA